MSENDGDLKRRTMEMVITGNDYEIMHSIKITKWLIRIKEIHFCDQIDQQCSMKNYQILPERFQP